MSVVEPGSAGTGLVARVKAMILQPKPTWEIIDQEPATIGGLYKGYVAPLALIPAVCMAIGSVVVGIGVAFMSYHAAPLAALASAVLQFVMILVFVFLYALIIDALAPSFGAQKNQLQAFKVAAYSFTPALVAGVVLLIPMLGVLVFLAGLYSLYLMYLGLPRLMKCPEDKAVSYTVVTVLAGFVAGLVLMLLMNVVNFATGGFGAMGALSHDSGSVSGKVKVGDTEVDLGKLEAASKQMEAAAKQMEAAANNPDAVKATDAEALKAFLPATLGGFARGDVSSESGGAAGFETSSAKASYTKGDARLTIVITDIGAAGAFGALANSFNVRSSSESNGRYEKTGRIDGRMSTESYDRNTKHGEFTVLAGDRFTIAAEGDGVSMDELKAAVAAVNPARLEALAKKG